MGKITRKPRLAIVNGEITTTSRAIADTFGKQHKDVLRRISTLDCSPEFHQRNFAQVSYTVEGGNGSKAEYIEYRITRDGFMFLTMGFTGKEAASWKETWIDTFNAMAQKLAQKQQKQHAARAKSAQSASNSRAKDAQQIGFDPASAIGADMPPPPDVEIPPELRDAIDARAIAMIGECLPAMRAYLRRDMLLKSAIKPSNKPGHIDPTRARAALQAASLAQALAYQAHQSARDATAIITLAHTATADLHNTWQQKLAAQQQAMVF